VIRNKPNDGWHSAYLKLDDALLQDLSVPLGLQFELGNAILHAFQPLAQHLQLKLQICQKEKTVPLALEDCRFNGLSPITLEHLKECHNIQQSIGRDRFGRDKAHSKAGPPVGLFLEEKRPQTQLRMAASPIQIA
jgi:hypothetical protein